MPHVHAWTDGSVWLAQRLVADCERLHQVIVENTRGPDPIIIPPLQVFLLSDYRSMKAVDLNPDGRPGGAMIATLRRGLRANYIFLNPQAWQGLSHERWYLEARRQLFQLYADHLLNVQRRLPPWYQLAVDDYAAATTFDARGRYTWGCSVLAAKKLRQSWQHVRTIMDPAISRPELTPLGLVAVSYFFSTPALRQQFGEYLRLSERGGTTFDAQVQRAFGMSVDALDAAVRGYALGDRTCSMNRPQVPFDDSKRTVRLLSRAETSRVLADALLESVGPTPEVQDLLLQAQSEAPGDPLPLLSLARFELARVETHESDAAVGLGRAEQHLSALQGDVATDASAWALRGHLHRLQVAMLLPAGSTEAKRVLTEARRAYRKSIRIDEGLAESYLGLGLTYLPKETGAQEAKDVLAAALVLRPYHCETSRALNQLLAARGEANATSAGAGHLERACMNPVDGRSAPTVSVTRVAR